MDISGCGRVSTKDLMRIVFRNVHRFEFYGDCSVMPRGCLSGLSVALYRGSMG